MIERSELEAAIRQAGSFNKAAGILGVNASTVTRHARAYGIPSPSKHVPYSMSNKVQSQPEAFPVDEATLVSDAVFLTPEEMLEERGINPNDVAYSTKLNQWEALGKDSEVITLRQMTVQTQQLKMFPVYHLEPNWKPQKPVGKIRKSSSLTVILSDQHFPNHDKKLHKLVLQFLATTQPDEIILLGDIADSSPFKRHRKNPKHDTSIKDYQVGVYKCLAEYRAVAPAARIRLIVGNHDWWIYQRIREERPELEELVNPVTGDQLLSLSKLFGLDSLYIDVEQPTGEYHDSLLFLTDDLVLLHGVKTGIDAARKEIQTWEGLSVAQGHAHKGQLTMSVKRTKQGESLRFAINVPSLSNRDLGYDHKRDVAQGFLVVQHHGELWNAELVPYMPQHECIMWRDLLFR